jgi:hypothetical protein
MNTLRAARVLVLAVAPILAAEPQEPAAAGAQEVQPAPLPFLLPAVLPASCVCSNQAHTTQTFTATGPSCAAVDQAIRAKALPFENCVHGVCADSTSYSHPCAPNGSGQFQGTAAVTYFCFIGNTCPS